MVQIAHNAFTFNNHVYLMNLLKRYAQEDVRFFLPISYGMYGINGQYGSKLYSKTVKRCARQILGDKAVILEKNIPFEQYLKVLWTVDVAVFDFDRPLQGLHAAYPAADGEEDIPPIRQPILRVPAVAGPAGLRHPEDTGDDI